MIKDWIKIKLDDQTIHIREKNIESLRTYMYNRKNDKGEYVRIPCYEVRMNDGTYYIINREQYRKILGETNG